MIGHPFLARVKVNHKRVYSRLLAKVCAGAGKTTLKKMLFAYFKKIQWLDFLSFDHYEFT